MTEFASHVPVLEVGERLGAVEIFQYTTALNDLIEHRRTMPDVDPADRENAIGLWKDLLCRQIEDCWGGLPRVVAWLRDNDPLFTRLDDEAVKRRFRNLYSE